MTLRIFTQLSVVNIWLFVSFHLIRILCRFRRRSDKFEYYPHLTFFWDMKNFFDSLLIPARLFAAFLSFQTIIILHFRRHMNKKWWKECPPKRKQENTYILWWRWVEFLFFCVKKEEIMFYVIRKFPFLSVCWLLGDSELTFPIFVLCISSFSLFS